MYTLFIYNNESSRLERYRLEPYCIMPYTTGAALYVSDFFRQSRSLIGWTNSSFLKLWSRLSKEGAEGHHFFRRISEGGHIQNSMHYAGLAADINTELHSSIFPFSEKGHVALFPAEYPDLSPASIGVFVLVLQDALMTLGYTEGELDGFFGRLTEQALINFQREHQLFPDGICTKQVWKTLTLAAAGCGKTKTSRYFR